MSMCAYHREFLACRTLQDLGARIESEWDIELRLEGDPNNREDWAHMDLDGGFIVVTPCPFGFLATRENQERLTGDSDDRDYVSQIDDENWERMKQALAELRL